MRFRMPLKLHATSLITRTTSFIAMSMVMIQLTGCVTRGDIDQLLEVQRETNRRLERMETAQNARPRPNGPIQPPRAPQPSADDVMAFAIGSAPQRGSADAWVTIVEVSDFQCPFCQRGANTMREVQKAYGNDVRIVFKHMPLPFHPRATPAAVAAVCAGREKRFWDMHDRIFAQQDQLSDEHLLAHAKELKLNVSEFKKCINSAEARAVVTSDEAQAATLGVRGTPAFFINGKFINGAQPFASFKTVIDAELARAKKSGIDKKSYYAQVVEAGGKKAL